MSGSDGSAGCFCGRGCSSCSPSRCCRSGLPGTQRRLVDWHCVHAHLGHVQPLRVQEVQGRNEGAGAARLMRWTKPQITTSEPLRDAVVSEPGDTMGSRESDTEENMNELSEEQEAALDEAREAAAQEGTVTRLRPDGMVPQAALAVQRHSRSGRKRKSRRWLRSGWRTCPMVTGALPALVSTVRAGPVRARDLPDRTEGPDRAVRYQIHRANRDRRVPAHRAAHPGVRGPGRAVVVRERRPVARGVAGRGPTVSGEGADLPSWRSQFEAIALFREFVPMRTGRTGRREQQL